jgi:multidrug efflux pump subunit AcrA (membrane-fusion protein)
MVAAAGYGGVRWFTRSAGLSATPAQVVPTARVTRGALALTVYLRGELRATRQVTLNVPAVGGAVRILNLVEAGTTVAKGDLVLEFDPADQEYAIEQAESELAEAEQEILKRRAEIKVQEAQDKVTLLTAEFDVRRATLDTALDADLISASDYKIRQAELTEAKRNLERLKQDVKTRFSRVRLR